MGEETQMTIQELRTQVQALLESGDVPEPVTDTWYLLEHTTGRTKADFFMDPDLEISPEVAEETLELAEKRKQRIPLQYLLGSWEFMGYEFRVNESVLIPRQDTEILVEEAVSRIKSGDRVLDLCTGSGCILVSVLKYAAEHGKTDLSGLGTDLSEKALDVAKANAKELLAEEAEKGLVQTSFCRGDLWDATDGTFDLILSNPPYIATAEIESLQEEVKTYDPYQALDGGADGLDFYRRIASDAGTYLKPGGILILEIGYDQGKAVSGLLKDAGFSGVCVKKDLAGLDRVVTGVYDK